MEDWMFEHIQGVLIFVEVLWVAGLLSIFVLYFVISRKLKRKKEIQQQMSNDLDENKLE